MAKRIKKTAPPEQIRAKFSASALERFCEVYIPQAPSVYTYGIPAELPEGVEIRRGSVVWVQFATRKTPLLAIVSKVVDRPSFDVRCAYPHASGYAFSERFMEALEWVARYYVSTPMKALDVFLPAQFDKYLDALADAEYVSGSGGTVPSGAELPPKPDVPPLTDEQQVALDSLVEDLSKEGFRASLLHGVTGSGKTRVYQELAYEALKRGKRVLILVPEIGLTPQTAGRFEDFLHVGVQVLHSALSAPKRRASYVSILKGEARVVLGTRSAILSPFDFDLVILDEEHDSSFKQQDPAPRYHTRELTFHLAYKYGAQVVLGSATPSLETYHNASTHKLKYLKLQKRATSASLPNVQIVDMGKIRQQKGILMSPDLRDALVKCVADGDQAIVLMNRRGYSKIRVCSECGETLFCKHCHVPLVYHKQYKSLVCHYCGLLYSVDSPCAACGAATYEYVGGAIERLEEEIGEWIPGAKVVEYNILLGTQMVSKGHDFPGVKLVGVVGADSGLGLPDFRSTERLFQLLSQTAGRAGRAQSDGKVLLQTLNPDEPVMQFALRHDFIGFAEKELRDRREACYPPFCKLVELSFGSKDEGALRDAVARVESLCRAEKTLMVMGPVDAFIPVVQNVRWVKLYLKTNDLAAVRRILSPVVNSAKPLIPGVEIKVEIE